MFKGKNLTVGLAVCSFAHGNKLKTEPKPLYNRVKVMDYGAFASMGFLQVFQSVKESVNVFVNV